MNLSDLKLYGLNTSALALSLTDVELMLKIVVLLATIGYTIHKWWRMANDKDKQNMIKALRRLANWLENLKCTIHFWWNAKLDSMKTNCVCEKSEK